MRERVKKATPRRVNVVLSVTAASVMGSWTLLFGSMQAGTESLGGSGQSGSAQAAGAIAGTAAVSGRSTWVITEEPTGAGEPRVARPVKPRRPGSRPSGGGSDAWYWEMVVVAVALAAIGGVAATARRFLPQGGAGGLQVMARVSLSPKHSVYVLRAGRRMLLVGAGPQGAPALISELDDFPEDEPAAPGREAP